MQNKLTIRFKPFEDESIISFFIRLSKDNGVSILQLLNRVKEEESDYIQLGEISIIEKFLFKHINHDKLENLLGFKVDFLLKNTFYNLIEKFNDGNKIEKARFICGIIRKDFYYCPKCLEENLYYRLIWRIEGIEICNKHGCFLLSRCYHCNHQIKYEEIIYLGMCSYCRKSLSKNIEKDTFDNNYFVYQSYLYESWNKLIYSKYNKMNSQEIAYKILYILNQKNSCFNREMIKQYNQEKNFFAMILQYARGTTKYKKTLHISIIIRVLFENKISIEEFLKLNIPKEFIVSVKEKRQSKLAETRCMAPWCKNYKVKGLLVKTNTTYKKLVNNNVLLYYMYCPECGCEYSYDENGNLVERTSFIYGFHKLNNTWNNSISIENISYNSNMSEDKVKRLLSYFNVRDIYLKDGKPVILKKELINIFINEIEKGSNLKKIMNLKCWSGYREFLLYRFHKEIMLAINMKKVVQNKETSIGIKSKKVIEVLEQLLKTDITITLNTVCNILNVYPETIRYWKCNKLIAEYKAKQKYNAIQKNREIIKEKIELFIEKNRTCYISPNDLYKDIGIQRNILWRHYPEITMDITNKIRQHNKLIN